MNKLLALLGAALGFALLVTGCETDGSSARIQEKSAAYATLKPWEKRFVDKGVVAVGFTPDMVYMAIGSPSQVQPMDTPEGKTELWTYKNYFPSTEASKVKYSLNTEQHFMNSGNLTPNAPGSLAGTPTASNTRTGPSSFQTGGPQGGSMEPADLASYTLYATFQNGKVIRLKLDPN